MSEKRNITIVVAFIVIAITLYLLFQSSHPLPLETEIGKIDTNSTVPTVDIRILNIDTIDHEVTVEVSSSQKSFSENIFDKRFLKDSVYLKPSTYVLYPGIPVKEENYDVNVIVDGKIKRTDSISFTGVNVFEIEITPETIDFGYVNREHVYLQEIYPDAVLENG